MLMIKLVILMSDDDDDDDDVLVEHDHNDDAEQEGQDPGPDDGHAEDLCCRTQEPAGGHEGSYYYIN